MGQLPAAKPSVVRCSKPSSACWAQPLGMNKQETTKTAKSVVFTPEAPHRWRSGSIARKFEGGRVRR